MGKIVKINDIIIPVRITDKIGPVHEQTDGKPFIPCNITIKFDKDDLNRYKDRQEKYGKKPKGKQYDYLKNELHKYIDKAKIVDSIMYYLLEEYAPQKNDPANRSGEVIAEIAKKQEEKQKLIEAYCQKAREIDGYRDQDAYRDCFMGIAPFLQLLLGAQRRFQLEGEAAVEILRTALRLDAQNANLDRELTAEGFKVAQVPSEYNEEALRASCEKVSNEVLQEEAEELDWKLRDCQRSLNYKEIIRGIEHSLYGIVQDIQSGNIERCVQCVPQLKGVLEKHNCHAIYWDDNRVKESETLRASFQEDGPYATELPGFFTCIDNNRYDRLGTLGGTMREISSPPSTQ